MLCLKLHWPRPNAAAVCSRSGRAKAAAAAAVTRTASTPASTRSARSLGNGLKDATTDPETIRGWWRQYPNAGIGQPMGAVNGLLDLDLDVRADRNGLDRLAALQLELECPIGDTLIAASPSEGQHRFYEYCEGIRGGDKLNDGIDVRCDGQYAVLPPSHGMYRWLNDAPIAKLPDVWIDYLRERSGPTHGVFSGPPEAEIARALAVIPNDALTSWSRWNDIGMAAFRATGGSDAGFQAFDDWSRKWPSGYDAEYTRQRWEAFQRSPPNRIGAGTIFFLAEQAAPGWRSVPPEVDQELDRLALLPRLAYELKRSDAAKQFNIRKSALDAEVEARRQVAQATYLQDHWKVEPWPQPVDTRQLLEATEKEITRYVATLGDRAIVPALWTLLTWVHEQATHSPILLPTSPEANSGKTTLASLLSFLVRFGLTSVGITGPALFRSIEKWRPTFVIDEADKAFAKNDDLREVVNSGWTRNQNVIRCHPETHEPFTYSTFAPKCVAMKGLHLPDTTLSRSLILRLKRKAPGEDVDDFEHLDTPKFAELRRKAARWSADNADLLQTARPETIPGFTNRRRMNWRHLLAIAE
jgi:hypothetical protein